MDAMKQKLIGVIVAVLLHLIVAVALSQDSIINFLLPKAKVENVVEKEKPKPVLSLILVPKKEIVAAPLPKVIPKPKPQKSYTRTSANQPQKKPKDAKFIGAHDTVAQSTAEAQADAPKIAAVNGEDRKHISSASDFQDGKLNDESVGKPQKPLLAEKPSPKKKRNPAEVAKPLAAANRRQEEYLKTLQKKPLQPQSLKPLKDIIDPKEGIAKQSESVDQKPKKAQPKLAKVASSKSGFKPRVDPTKNKGSIMRKGNVSSNDTAATPEGRYKQSVLDAIYKDWNSRMSRHPDLTLPGVLELRWYVYAPGKVKQIRPISEKNGSAIQKGITFQAISQAKIPRMPKKLQRELNGEPMEFSVTFYF